MPLYNRIPVTSVDGDTGAVDLSGTYAPIGRAVPGNRTVWIGDSHVEANDAPTVYSDTIPTLVGMISGQKWWRIGNVADGGRTSTTVLSNFDAEVAPLTPDVVVMCVGRNDAVTGFATYQSNVAAIVAKIRLLGAMPVICTIPPVAAHASQRQTEMWNGWLRRYARDNRIPLVDFWAKAVDPATGAYLAAYECVDGVHAGAEGRKLLAQHFCDVMDRVASPAGPTLAGFTNSTDNMLRNALFTGALGGSGGAPDYWYQQYAATGSTLSLTTDSEVKGQLVTFTHAGASALRGIAQDSVLSVGTVASPATAGATAVSYSSAVKPEVRDILHIGSGATKETVKINTVVGASTPYTVNLIEALIYDHAAGETVVGNGAVGDTISLAGIITSDGAIAASAGLTFTGAGTTFSPCGQITVPLTRGVFWGQTTIPTGTTRIITQLQLASGTGVASFGQVCLRNLSREY